MKRFYSWIDTPTLAPQSLQHLAIHEYAKKVGGGIVFFGSEDNSTLSSQAGIAAKLRSTLSTEGFIFFTIHQFRYGDSLNWKLLKSIIMSGMEVHFARDGISLYSSEDLSRQFNLLHSIDFTVRRDQGQWWRNLVKELSLRS